MRKFFIIAAIGLLAHTTYAQFGLRFAPNLSLNRLTNDLEDADIEKNGAGMRFSFGPTLDMNVGDHVAFSTGLWFTSKRASLKWSDSTDTQVDVPVFGLHYLQIPVSIKYYTNDITSKLKIYFQIGGTLDWNIAEKVLKSDLDKSQTKDYYGDIAKIIDAGAYIGSGVELKIGESNTLFGGLVYNRGLSNLLTKDFVLNNKELKLSTQLISLEMGIKF